MSQTWMIAKKEKGLSCNLKPHSSDTVPLECVGCVRECMCERNMRMRTVLSYGRQFFTQVGVRSCDMYHLVHKRLPKQ